MNLILVKLCLWEFSCKLLALLWLEVVALLAPVMKSTSFFKHKWLYSSRRFVLLCTKASALALTLSSGSGLTENLKLEKTFGESAASWRKIRNLDVVCIFCICKYVCMYTAESSMKSHYNCYITRTTDTRWLNPEFFVAQIQIPIPNKYSNKYLGFEYKSLVFFVKIMVD